MSDISIYTRVSTADQDPERQLDELREFVEDSYADPEIHAYADIISGTQTDQGEEYQRLREDIEDGILDVIVVHELSRLSRLGAGEIHEFLEFCLTNETSVRDLEVGLEISLNDDLVDRAVSQLIAGVMEDLDRVEHKQKLRRIQSRISAAQDAGQWTGRPPAGFEVEDEFLRVDTDAPITNSHRRLMGSTTCVLLPTAGPGAMPDIREAVFIVGSGSETLPSMASTVFWKSSTGFRSAMASTPLCMVLKARSSAPSPRKRPNQKPTRQTNGATSLRLL